MTNAEKIAEEWSEIFEFEYPDKQKKELEKIIHQIAERTREEWKAERKNLLQIIDEMRHCLNEYAVHANPSLMERIWNLFKNKDKDYIVRWEDEEIC